MAEHAAPLAVPLVEARGLGAIYDKGNAGQLVVLDEITLSLWPGEIVGLLGRSGSGKSTLLRLIAGLIAPTRGTVTFEGTPVTGPAEGIAMVFQSFALFPWLTVLQNVELGLEAQGVAPAERRLWFEGRVPIEAILMVTHNIEEAVLMCDRLLLLSSSPGRIVFELAIDLPQPRSRLDPAFHAIVEDIYARMTAIEPGSLPAHDGIFGHRDEVATRIDQHPCGPDRDRGRASLQGKGRSPTACCEPAAGNRRPVPRRRNAPAPALRRA